MAIFWRLQLFWFRLFWFGLVWFELVRIGFVRLGQVRIDSVIHEPFLFFLLHVQEGNLHMSPNLYLNVYEPSSLLPCNLSQKFYSDSQTLFQFSLKYMLKIGKQHFFSIFLLQFIHFTYFHFHIYHITKVYHKRDFAVIQNILRSIAYHAVNMRSDYIRVFFL